MEKTLSPPRRYVTWKVNFHSLICMQLRLSNISAYRLYAKAWGLLPLGTMVGDKVEKLVGRNWPPPYLMRRQFLYWIARVMARWQRSKAGRSMAIELDRCMSWKLCIWYTIRCMRAWLGRAKFGVDKEVYLV